MSHAPSSVSLHDVPTILSAPPLSVSKTLKGILWVMFVAGVLVFAMRLMSGGTQAHTAWLVFHANFIFWFSLAAGSTCFSAALQISNAEWSRPIRRLFESTLPFFFFSLIPLVVLYFGKANIFPWATETIAGKASWLSPDFVFIRDFVAILVLAVMARKLVHFSLQCDFGAVQKGLTGLSKDQTARWTGEKYESYVDGWSDDAKAEISEVQDKMGVLSPILVAVYAVVMTLFAFDQVMSVDPHWFSTLFGAFIFMTAVYIAVAWNAIGVGLAREFSPLIRAKVERRTLHDLGKLLFGFGIFWAYLFWSHYLTIWYANMPEETGYMILRFRLPPWHALGWVVLGCCFIVPFFLGLNRDVKQVPQLLGLTGAIVLVGVWLQSYMLITPGWFPNEIPLQALDVAITLGFAGAFLLSVLSFLAKVPLIPFGDLYVKK